jgi:hypothetical protein
MFIPYVEAGIWDFYFIRLTSNLREFRIQDI